MMEKDKRERGRWEDERGGYGRKIGGRGGRGSS